MDVPTPTAHTHIRTSKVHSVPSQEGSGPAPEVGRSPTISRRGRRLHRLTRRLPHTMPGPAHGPAARLRPARADRVRRRGSLPQRPRRPRFARLFPERRPRTHRRCAPLRSGQRAGTGRHGHPRVRRPDPRRRADDSAHRCAGLSATAVARIRVAGKCRPSGFTGGGDGDVGPGTHPNRRSPPTESLNCHVHPEHRARRADRAARRNRTFAEPCPPSGQPRRMARPTTGGDRPRLRRLRTLRTAGRRYRIPRLELRRSPRRTYPVRGRTRATARPPSSRCGITVCIQALQGPPRFRRGRRGLTTSTLAPAADGPAGFAAEVREGGRAAGVGSRHRGGPAVIAPNRLLVVTPGAAVTDQVWRAIATGRPLWMRSR
jgi:hypothetical protein